MATINRDPRMSPAAFTGPFYVINSVTGLAVQSESCAGRAGKARDDLNAHEARSGRPAIYVVRESTGADHDRA